MIIKDDEIYPPKNEHVSQSCSDKSTFPEVVSWPQEDQVHSLFCFICKTKTATEILGPEKYSQIFKFYVFKC